MARKIFVSYKFGDSDVRSLQSNGLIGYALTTTARDYVNKLESLLDINDHIYKGENDNESLEGFKDDTITSKLQDKIYDSSITLVLISKNMKDLSRAEDDQWIPWEISYSLREKTRDGRTSRANAVLAIVLPDKNGNYHHFIQDNTCTHCNSSTLMTDSPNTFQIIKHNMFNHKRPNKVACGNHSVGNEPHFGDHSYIHTVKWDNFISDVNTHIDTAVRINGNISDYEVVKSV